MRHRLRDLPGLATTSIGRRHLADGLSYLAWPLTSQMAMLHRRTLARSTRIVAVVGSLGKTTTRRAIIAALGLPPARTHFNAWGSIARAVMSIGPGQPHAVIEVGIGDKGQMRPYASVLRPDVTVVTSIGSEHHRSLGTLYVTRDEKAWMVRGLRPGGVAVLNGDDANVMWMAGETSARIITCGFGGGCDVRAERVRVDWPHGMRFTLVGLGPPREVALRLFGRHMVFPALAALAVAQLEGVALDEALARLGEMPASGGRMEPVALPGGVTLLRDEVKSTTESIDAALHLVAEIPARRRIVVLGDISEPIGRQRPAYQRVGELVAKCATHLLVAGPSRDKYVGGALRGGMPAERVIEAGRTPRELATTLAAMLEPGDVVMVKGRDTQKLDRVRLILSGRDVRCDIPFCSVRTVTCASCPMLERAWGGIPPLSSRLLP